MIKGIICLCAVLSLGGCANYNFSNKTTHQGNLSVISGDKKLHKGMSKTEVAQIMGSSLITPMFSQNRWDYALTSQKPNKKVIVKSVVLYFKNDRLTRIIKNA